MMLPDLVDQLATLANAATALLAQVGRIMPALRPLLGGPAAAVAYETLRLELVLDIQDPSGMQAVLERRQRVRVLADEAEAVREVVWGEGEQLARYRARGARRMLVRAEGSRRAVLLGLSRRPSKGEQLTISSRRLIRAGFLQDQEYCETWLERPTHRVAMTVIFPQQRPPREAQLVTAAPLTPSRRVPIRFAADGRAFVRWTLTRPAVDRTYSLRWSW